MYRPSSFFITLTLILFVFFSRSIQYAHAETDSLKLSVAPTHTNISLKVGDTWSSSVQITNINDRRLPYNVRVAHVRDDGSFVWATTEVTSTDNHISRSASVEQWIEVGVLSFSLSSNEHRQIPVKITVPPDATPGDYRALVLVGVSPGKGIGSSASVESYVGSAFSIHVEGDLLERGDITEFSVPKRWFISNIPEVRIRFKNNGNTRLEPKGHMSFIKETMSDRVFSHQSTIEQFVQLPTTLPAQSAYVTISPQDSSWFETGYYRAIIRLSYGVHTTEFIDQTVDFYVVSFSFLFTLLCITASLLWLLVVYCKKRYAV